MLKKRTLKIINFLYLSDDKYNKIRDYRNQQYIREVSLNPNVITEEEHQIYRSLLQQQKSHFAFLITNNDVDYGVITLKKIAKDTFYIGDYLVKEEYQYEGGGVANKFCIMYLCNQLNIKYLQSEFKLGNTRGHRTGIIAEIKSGKTENGFYKETTALFDFYDEKVRNLTARKLFDKVYEIVECKL